MGYIFRVSIPTATWITLAIILAVLIIVVLLVVAPVVFFRIVVDRDRITFKFILPSFTINREDVVHVHIVDLDKHPELRPTMRLFGIGLPGFKIGWFKLANGKKAYLAVDGWKGQAVLMELKDGNIVIVTVQNFDRFIQVLKSLGWIG